MEEVRLYRATGPTDAYLLRQWLDERGIACTLRGESLMGLAGGIPVPDSYPSVWVAHADLQAAQQALTAWRGPALAHPAWVCAGCGEDNPASFQMCWSCERAR